MKHKIIACLHQEGILKRVGASRGTACYQGVPSLTPISLWDIAHSEQGGLSHIHLFTDVGFLAGWRKIILNVEHVLGCLLLLWAHPQHVEAVRRHHWRQTEHLFAHDPQPPPLGAASMWRPRAFHHPWDPPTHCGTDPAGKAYRNPWGVEGLNSEMAEERALGCLLLEEKLMKRTNCPSGTSSSCHPALTKSLALSCSITVHHRWKCLQFQAPTHLSGSPPHIFLSVPSNLWVGWTAFLDCCLERGSTESHHSRKRQIAKSYKLLPFCTVPNDAHTRVYVSTQLVCIHDHAHFNHIYSCKLAYVCTLAPSQPLLKNKGAGIQAFLQGDQRWGGASTFPRHLSVVTSQGICVYAFNMRMFTACVCTAVLSVAHV